MPITCKVPNQFQQVAKAIDRDRPPAWEIPSWHAASRSWPLSYCRGLCLNSAIARTKRNGPTAFSNGRSTLVRRASRLLSRNLKDVQAVVQNRFFPKTQHPAKGVRLLLLHLSGELGRAYHHRSS